MEYSDERIDPIPAGEPEIAEEPSVSPEPEAPDFACPGEAAEQ